MVYYTNYEVNSVRIWWTNPPNISHANVEVAIKDEKLFAFQAPQSIGGIVFYGLPPDKGNITCKMELHPPEFEGDNINLEFNPINHCKIEK